ncbi:hypothetical protein BJ138DRAFT_206512 [Hygrophoropsis aurantiaca]|uniref:Uncharacterized protein n=1 Tax=Hygrophoropsis aurantiaca TaxID=72124 RepID=A0ACB8A969_9AGAM|nr:hypothetical protein BJ138DRAFT_206512 [Hygrophoropsis aurantiaca]
MANVRKFIEHDVDDFRPCPVDNMLTHLLYECRDKSVSVNKETLLKQCLEAVLPLANGIATPNQTIDSQGIKANIITYTETQRELRRYAPFTVAANTALMCLGDINIPGIRAPKAANDHQNILFQRHDLKGIVQVHKSYKSVRKPDVVVLSWEGAREGHPGGQGKDKATHFLVDAQENPIKSAKWRDVRCAIEFKAKKKGTLPKPPRTYTVKNWVPTKPELLDLPYLRNEEARREEQTSSYVAQTASNVSSLGNQGSSVGSKRSRPDDQASVQSLSKRSKRPKTDANSEPPDDPADGLPIIEAPVNTPAIVQCGAYAAEMFSSHLGLQHIINLVIIDDLLYIWYLDRQQAIQCYGFNFVQDLPRFLVLLLVMDRLTEKQWGINGTFEIGETKRMALGNEHDKVVMVLGSPVSIHFGLRGRATNVYSISELEMSGDTPYPQLISGDKYVVKIFWSEESRENEPELIKKAHAIAQTEPDVIGHLPEPVWWSKFPDTSTASIRQALDLHNSNDQHDGENEGETDDNGEDNDETEDRGKNLVCGSRVLWAIVFRKLQPITQLGPTAMLKGWWQIVKCHHALWKGGLYHRDISENNLMFYRDKHDNAIGVLNDFDLSSTKETRQGNERTGTIPFMAMQLLDEEGIRGIRPHLYRHDAESLIWVLAWISLAYENGYRRRAHEDLQALFGPEPIVCAKYKRAFVMDGRYGVKPLPSQAQNWEVANNCLGMVFMYYAKRPLADLSDDCVYQEWVWKSVEPRLTDIS